LVSIASRVEVELEGGPPGAPVRMRHEVESFQSSLVLICRAGAVAHCAGQRDGDVTLPLFICEQDMSSHEQASADVEW
jgi:hypothetical protein